MPADWQLVSRPLATHTRRPVLLCLKDRACDKKPLLNSACPRSQLDAGCVPDSIAACGQAQTAQTALASDLQTVLGLVEVFIWKGTHPRTHAHTHAQLPLSQIFCLSLKRFSDAVRINVVARCAVNQQPIFGSSDHKRKAHPSYVRLHATVHSLISQVP